MIINEQMDDGPKRECLRWLIYGEGIEMQIIQTDSSNENLHLHHECRKRRAGLLDALVHGRAHLDTCQSVAAAAAYLRRPRPRCYCWRSLHRQNTNRLYCTSQLQVKVVLYV